MTSEYLLHNNLKVWNCGSNGLVGSALTRALNKEEWVEIKTPSREKLDLRCQSDVLSFVSKTKPDIIFLSAAMVGGIIANKDNPAMMITNNLQIQTNIIHAAWKYNVKKLVFLGSSCIYPKIVEQPIPEEAFLSGKLEPTNQSYSIAKIAGIEMCRAFYMQYGCNFISVMPANLYGINDNFNLENAHVLPALIRKFHEAKISGDSEVILWGTGTALREFLYVDDLAKALIFVAKNYNQAAMPINIGAGKEISIKELAKMMAEIIGYKGKIRFDLSKPDGTPCKLLDISRIDGLGWSAETTLREGITKTYNWFKSKAQDPAFFQEHRTKYDLW